MQPKAAWSTSPEDWLPNGANTASPSTPICPGYFWTPLTKDTLETDWFTEYAKGTIPVERYGKEGELDSATIFLASPASSYVNGTAIPVDGGYTCV